MMVRKLKFCIFDKASSSIFNLELRFPPHSIFCSYLEIEEELRDNAMISLGYLIICYILFVIGFYLFISSLISYMIFVETYTFFSLKWNSLVTSHLFSLNVRPQSVIFPMFYFPEYSCLCLFKEY